MGKWLLKAKSLYCFPETYVVVDVETTGGSAKTGYLTEIGAVKVVDHEVVDTFQSLIQPPLEKGVYVSSFIENLTHITNEMLATAPKKEAVLPAFLAFIEDFILVGHNVCFDLSFLNASVDSTLKNDYVDTLFLAKQIWPQSPKYNLTYLCQSLGIETKHAHRALADALHTQALLEVMRTSVKQLPKLERYVKADWYPANEQADASHPLYGKHLVMTGKLQYKRHQWYKRLANMGIYLSDRITTQTDYLVVNPGQKVSRKLDQALQLGIQCITEEQLIEWVKGR